MKCGIENYSVLIPLFLNAKVLLPLEYCIISRYFFFIESTVFRFETVYFTFQLPSPTLDQGQLLYEDFKEGNKNSHEEYTEEDPQSYKDLESKRTLHEKSADIEQALHEDLKENNQLQYEDFKGSEYSNPSDISSSEYISSNYVSQMKYFFIYRLLIHYVLQQFKKIQ